MKPVPRVSDVKLHGVVGLFFVLQIKKYIHNSLICLPNMEGTNNAPHCNVLQVLHLHFLMKSFCKLCIPQPTYQTSTHIHTQENQEAPCDRKSFGTCKILSGGEKAHGHKIFITSSKIFKLDFSEHSPNTAGCSLAYNLQQFMAAVAFLFFLLRNFRRRY